MTKRLLSNFRPEFAFVAVLLLVLAACSTQPVEAPTIQLTSPESGIQVALGERVLVQSLAKDDKGVVKTELWVDGRL